MTVLAYLRETVNGLPLDLLSILKVLKDQEITRGSSLLFRLLIIIQPVRTSTTAISMKTIIPPTVPIT